MLQIARDFSLPLEAVTETFAILAKRGMGKTYLAAVIVEEMLKAGQVVVVADPVGVWWGLRASADGKKAGLPIVVLGGEHGDLPLNVDSGEQVAEIVVGERTPMVLDLSQLRKGEMVRFMTAFAETLYRKNRQPLHLVLDEADAFAPQKPFKGDERLLGAMEDIVRRGRARGLGVTMITQRPAVLNKNVLTQIEVLVVLRMVGKHDYDAVEDWTRINGTKEQRDELMSVLPSLDVGEAWFWSPGWLKVFRQVHVRHRETFDSSATPKVGETVAAPKVVAAVDLERLRGLLAPPPVEKSADNVAALKKQVADLKRQLAEKPKAEPIEVSVLKDEHVEQLRRVAEEAIERGQALIGLGQEMLVQMGKAQPRKPVFQPTSGNTSGYRSRLVVEKAAEPPDDTASLRAGERRILQAIAQRYPKRLTRAQIGTLAGFTPSGGTFGTYFGTLKRHGLIVERGGEVEITQAGLDYLGVDVPTAPQTTQELLTLWRNALRAGEAKMLDVLVQAYPDSLTRDTLGELSGYSTSGGTFGTYLGTLRRNGLAEVEGQWVRASDTLFIDVADGR